MTPADLLADLAQRLKLQDLQLNEKGLACLVLDDKITIQLEHETATNRFHLYTVLGTVPAEGKEALYETLLTGNLFGHQTGGATLALDEITGEVILFLTLNPDKTDSTDFEKALEDFAAAAEHWKEKFSEAGSAGGNGKASSADTFSAAAFPQGGIRA